MRRALVVALALGCGGPEQSRLAVDIVTDLVPGVEFDEAEVRVTPTGASRAETATIDAGGRDFTTGARVELEDLAPGPSVVRVELRRDDGLTLLSSSVLVDIDGDRGITVVLTRDCRGIECDETARAEVCFAGRCVDARCSAENPEACAADACSGDEDCASPVECAEARCVAGACIAFPRAERCAAGEYCAPETGCELAPAPALDAGSLDAGPLDAGADAGTDSSTADATSSDAAHRDASAAALCLLAADDVPAEHEGTLVACPSADALTVRSLGRFRLVLTQNAGWQVAAWFDEQSEPASDLRDRMFASVQHPFVIASTTAALDWREYLDRNAELTILEQTFERVVVQIVGEYVVDSTPFVRVSVTYTFQPDGSWATLGEIENVRSVTIEPLIEYADTHVDPALGWTVMSTPTRYSMSALSATGTPLSVVVQSVGASPEALVAADEPGNSYFVPNVSRSLASGERLRFEWTTTLWSPDGM